METTKRRMIASGITAVSLAAVVAGVAAAQPSGTAADSTPAATEQAEEAGDVEEQEPRLNGSIQAPDDESLSEDEEAAQLAQMDGLISEADAVAAATADGGTADGAELENENGSVIWEVEVTADDGTVQEVAVDAGNGDVLATETDDESEEDESDENESEEDDDEEEDENESEEDEEDEADEADEAAENEAGQDAANG